MPPVSTAKGDPLLLRPSSGCPELVASSSGLTKLILKPSAKDSDRGSVSRSAKVTPPAPTSLFFHRFFMLLLRFSCFLRL